MAKLTPEQAWLCAAEWGSLIRARDPGACMYGFDEHGRVQSEAHRAACIAWIDTHCRRAADVNIASGEDPATQHPHLDELRAYLLTAPVWES